MLATLTSRLWGLVTASVALQIGLCPAVHTLPSQHATQSLAIKLESTSRLLLQVMLSNLGASVGSHLKRGADWFQQDSLLEDWHQGPQQASHKSPA